MARSPFPIEDESAEIVVYQGGTYTEQHAFFDAVGNLYNTHGHTATMTVKESTDDADALLSTDDSPTSITVLTGTNGTLKASTTLASGAATDDTAVTVTSATGIETGQQMTIALDSGSTHVAVITEIAGTTVTLGDAVPSAAAAGNAVETYANAYCLDVYIAPGNADGTAKGTATLPDGLVGVYDLWLQSPDGLDSPIFKQRFCVDAKVRN